MTICDGLTGIANVRHLDEFLDREFARSRRHGRDLCVLMMDLDHFKNINDEFGHLTGDFVLRELAGLLAQRVRREELLARYGGEEFVLVLPETRLDGAVLNTLGGLRDLEELDLKATSITDDSVKTLLTMKNVRRLNLAGTQLSDEGFSQLSQMPSLTWLNVANTNIGFDIIQAHAELVGEQGPAVSGLSDAGLQRQGVQWH